jgi:hypothetical protein
MEIEDTFLVDKHRKFFIFLKSRHRGYQKFATQYKMLSKIFHVMKFFNFKQMKII